MPPSPPLGYANMPRLYLSQPPLHTYYYVGYTDVKGYFVVPCEVSWQYPNQWDSVLKRLALVSERAEFSCWLDSTAGDAFLQDHHWAPILSDGVLAPAPPLFAQF